MPIFRLRAVMIDVMMVTMIRNMATLGEIAGYQQYDGQRWQHGVFGGNAIRRTLFVVDQAQQKTQRPYADARRVFHKLLHAFLRMECDCGRNAQRIDDGQNGDSGWFSDTVFWLAAVDCLML